MSEERRVVGGRYRIVSHVGQGGVGSVYRAIQEPLGRDVALKILRPEYSNNPIIRRRFTREARAVAALDHPNIAKIFDFGVEEDNTLFLAMEFIHGEPLSVILQRGVSPDLLLAILDPILAALAHAHARGIIHRDLKPDNILVGYPRLSGDPNPDAGGPANTPQYDTNPPPQSIDQEPQRVKLVDFGIATVYGEASKREPSDTKAGEVVGTPLYMAPEQARGERSLAPAVDLYMIGVVLYEGLSGRHPFTGLDPDETAMDIMIRHVTMAVPELNTAPGVYIPEALRATVKRCLSKKASDRFASAAQLRDALREARALLQAHQNLHSASTLSSPATPSLALGQVAYTPTPVEGLYRAKGDTQSLDEVDMDDMYDGVTISIDETHPGESAGDLRSIAATFVPSKVDVVKPAWLNPSSKLSAAHRERLHGGSGVFSSASFGGERVELKGTSELSAAISSQLSRVTSHSAPSTTWHKLRSDIRSALRGVRFDVPMVGREEERERLIAMAEECMYQGSGQVVLLEGEVGVGKTKLASWLVEHVAEQGKMRTVKGVFVREDKTGLRGLRDALEALFGVRERERTHMRDTIAEKLGRWGIDDPRDAEALTVFLRPMDQTGALKSSQEHLFALLVRILERAGRERPLMLVLDDIHWAGATLGEFLEFLAIEFRYRPCAVLLIASLNNEDLTSNPSMIEARRKLSRHVGETVVRMPIHRLQGAECAVLIESVLPASEGLRETIIRRSHGNPLHVVQLLQYLYQEELLIWNDDSETFDLAAADASMVHVPPDLADLLLLRFEQIEDRHSGNGRILSLLEHCAVLGERFPFDVLELMCKASKNSHLADYLEEGVEILLRESILTSLKGRGEDILAFNHSMIREVVRKNTTGLLQSRRLHRLAAVAKERYYQANLESVAQEVAHHALEAGDKRKALDFLLMAATSARSGHRVGDAIALFSQATSLARIVPGVEPSLLLTLARRIATLLESIGKFHQAARVCATLLRMALFESGERFAQDLAELPEQEPIPHSEIDLLLEAVRNSPRLRLLNRTSLEEVVRACITLGSILLHTSSLEPSTAFLEEAHALATREALRGWITAANLQLGRVAWTRGDYNEAQIYADEGLKAALRTGNAHNRAEALHLLAEIARLRNDPARTAELLIRAREAYEILNDRRHAAQCIRDLAQLARARNDLENAARLFAEARQRFEELGDRHAVASCFNGLGEVARFSGRPKVANSCYRRAFETFHSLGATMDAVKSLTNLGLCALGERDLEQADHALTHALDLMKDLVVQPYISMGLHLSIALLRAYQDRWDHIPTHLSVALDHHDRHQIADPDYARPLENLADLFEEHGDNETADVLRERAQQMWMRLGLA